MNFCSLMPGHFLTLSALFLMAPGLHARQDSPVTSPLERPNPAVPAGPVPSWVTPLEVDRSTPPPLVPNQSSPGIYYRLIDVQKHAESGEGYHHYADELLTTAGVHENGEISIEFDPEYEALTIHHVRIHRGKETLDALETAFVRETRPEDEFDSTTMLYGHREWIIVPADLRPGDILDYAYTIRGSNPFYEGRFFDVWDINWENPLLRSRYRLVKKKSRALFTRNHRTGLKAVRRPLADGLEEWTWEAANLPPVVTEPDVPGWFDPFSWVELSEFDDWSQVRDLGRSHYDFTGGEDGPAIREALARIRGEHPGDRNAQATAAMRLVQDDVRYLGIEEGSRAFLPVDPNVTMQRRFGDCKDKTVLLHHLLGRLGIASAPVYVDLDEGRTLPDRLPSVIAFDHVILRAELDAGMIVYSDCTQTHVGGKGAMIPALVYRWGLALDGEPGGGLEEIPYPSPRQNRIHSLTHLRPREIGESAEKEVTTHYFGSEANAQRFFAQTEPPETTRRDFLDFYREDYGDVAVLSPPQISDDRDANRFTIRESYRIESPWEEDASDPGWYSFTVHFREIREFLVKPGVDFRKMPFAFPHPRQCRQEFQVHLSPPGEWDFDEEIHFIEAPAFTLRREVTYDAKRGILKLAVEFESLEDHVLPEKLAEHNEKIDHAYELVRFDLWNLDESPASVENGSGAEPGIGPVPGSIGPVVLLAILLAAIFGGILMGALITAIVFVSRRRKAGTTGPSR